MVKLGKKINLKAFKKLAKKQNASPTTITNKVLKKKENVARKVTFQKEILLKESLNVTEDNRLVKNVLAKQLISELSSKSKGKLQKPAENEQTSTEVKQPKLRSVEKHKKRHKTVVSDTKLLLKLMSGKGKK